MSLFWLRVAAVLYAAGLVHTFLTVLRRGGRFFPYALAAFHVGVVLHFVSFVEHSVELRHLAANNFYETASLCALIFAVVYLFMEWRYHFAILSIFIFPLVSLLTMISAMGAPMASWEDVRVRNAWLIAHIVLVLVGYAGLLLSAGAAVFYLLQERRLKRKHGNSEDFISMVTPERLPPLETLDTLITRSMSVGFVAVTLAVVAGSSWASIEYGTRWISEAKIVVSLVTWGFYLLMVFLRISAGWRGRKAAVLSLTVLGFAAITWAAHVGLRPLLAK
ncbi:cytochrome c biogenesis protein CcsA [uncultured Paludibaculum sp.]|uniref:cytochrome C assembly family protein n=1 Tax=uncultured Paludibaculum sp. TaxID=1765020 RepID=UPI002AAA9441|nr:cytochrome c biogenesis protein CcsA [uncultured Paludibaculum sp.]